MTEFENWNKLRGIDFRMRFSTPRQFEAYIEQEREDSYAAALEWALSIFNSNIYSSDNTDDMSKVVDIYSMIKEELDYNATTEERPRSGLRFSS